MGDDWLTGVSAFPLTPLRDGRVDGAALAGLVHRLVGAGVESIGLLGSTGAYTYLTREQRRDVARIAAAESDGVPVLVGVGHCASSEVGALAQDAQQAGARGVLLAPVAYQPPTDDEIVALYEDAVRELSVPLVVYDNPATTHVELSLETYARVASLPRVAAVKIPPVPLEAAAARAHLQRIREAVPASVRIGVSGDAAGAAGLLAGCDLWFSALGGTLPEHVLAIARAAQSGDAALATALSDRLQGLWDLFARCGGSIRVVAEIAAQLGLVQRPVLPRPLLPLDPVLQGDVAEVLAGLGVSRPGGRAGSG